MPRRSVTKCLAIMGSRSAGVIAAVAALALLALGAGHASAAYPPASTGKILFSRDGDLGPDFNFDVFAVNSDGTGLTNLTPGTAEEPQHPMLSPNGRLIVFDQVQPSPSTDADVFLMNADGTGVVNLTPGNTTDDRMPTFSPDGRRITFIREVAPDDYDVFSMNLGGAGLVDISRRTCLRLPTGLLAQRQEASSSSPGGRAWAPSARALWIAGTDGSGPRQLLPPGPAPGSDLDPVFSPDGRRVAFSRTPAEEILIVGIDGTGLVSIGKGLTNEAFGASSAPNGSQIAFDEDGSGVHVMNADGTGSISLTGDTNGFHPSWEYVYTCAGRRATIVGDAGPDKIKGTRRRDVIVGNARPATRCAAAAATTGSAAARGATSSSAARAGIGSGAEQARTPSSSSPPRGSGRLGIRSRRVRAAGDTLPADRSTPT